MKKLIYIIAVALIGGAACSGEKEDVENPIHVEETVEAKDTVPAIVVASPLVVTPEFWENFSTEIAEVVFFTSKDSLSEPQAEFVNSIEEHVTIPNVGYHQVFSSDSAAFVFLNDSLMFDFTQYKLQFGEGYFLLKPGKMPDAFGFVDDVDMVSERIKTYYQ